MAGRAGTEVIGQRLLTGEMVLREVGRGALARVYLVSNGQSVRALKLLPPGQAARVDHEHGMAHDLDHPHLGSVHARVDLGDRPGLLMPLVFGRRLLVRGTAFAERIAYLEAFAQLLSALDHLHAKRRVHRDVKPENVLLDRSGRVKLIDFDLGLRLDTPQDAPRVAGTLAYLSPEQARGDVASPRSDLYAAGVMLYAALTGEIPFHGTVAERLLAAAPHVEAPRPSAIDPALRPADDLVRGLLARRPEDRFQDAAAAATELEVLRTAWRPNAPTDAGAGFGSEAP